MNSDCQDQKIPYDEMLPQVRTGDILLFHGSSKTSREIEFATGSRFSHVGVAIRPDVGRAPLIWQTGPNPITRDPRTHTRHGGAQLGHLLTTLQLMGSVKYGDVPHWRQLKVKRTKKLEDAVLRFVANCEGRAFPSLLRMVEEFLEGQLHVFSGKKTMFCAELVASTYQAAGLLADSPPANWYDPKAFSQAHERLDLQLGASLGQEYEIELPGAREI